MRPHGLAGAVLAIVLATPVTAFGTPLDFVPVGDPLEDELRLLEVADSSAFLPHFAMRPLQVLEIHDLDARGGRGAGITRERIRRALARDQAAGGGVRRLIQVEYPDDQRFEVSAGIEGGVITTRGQQPGFTSLSGLRLRFGVQNQRWVAHTDLLAGHAGGLRFANRLLAHRDLALHSEEAYLGYSGEGGRWAVQFGRSRWQWGPGQEATLLLSGTSVPLTGMALRLRISPLRADGIALSATLDESAGEQLAAHRLEWQPLPNLRVGLSEAARYKSSRWEPLYWVGVLPYSIVQNILFQDEPDSLRAVRNNVLASVDATWRVIAGQRVYGDLLIDDLRTDSAPTVSSYGYQWGWEGVGAAPAVAGRLSWGMEYTRLTRFVYTSSYGRQFVAQGQPLGFPTGPDSRRVRLRAAWDPSVAWQLSANASRTDVGESGIDRPFVGPLGVNAARFLGAVETSKDVEAGLRYWPSAGVDASLSFGYRWVDGFQHVATQHRREPRAEVRLRLVR